jgi:hypothetical protein
MTQTEQRFDENASAVQTEVERLKHELSREHDLHLRALADFDNYRKRVQRERESIAQAGKRQLMLALLDVLDDFERALAYADAAPASILVLRTAITPPVWRGGSLASQARSSRAELAAYSLRAVLSGGVRHPSTVDSLATGAGRGALYQRWAAV